LQILDEQIWLRTQELERIPEAIAATERAHAEEAQVVTVADERHKVLQVAHKGKEGDLSAKEAAIKKSQTQLLQLKTNKEYTAMQQEIAGFKADQSLIEDEILALLDQMDAAKTALVREQGALAEKKSVMESTKQELTQEGQQLERELADLQTQRAEKSGQVPAHVLSRYERILSNREGVALVPVAHESCGGCSMSVPPQVVHQLRVGEELITCESCARILYWDPESG
jgi:uncharacterized protein